MNPILNIMISLLANLGFYIIASIICVRCLLLTTGVDGLINDRDLLSAMRLAGPLAYDHFVRAIRHLVALVYQCLECLRCKRPVYSFIKMPPYLPLPRLQFANVHDISWGTKGDNTIAKDLGTVTTSTTGKKGEVEAELPTDVDVFYENAIYVLNMKSPEVDSKLDEGTQQGDYYRTFRTK